MDRTPGQDMPGSMKGSLSSLYGSLPSPKRHLSSNTLISNPNPNPEPTYTSMIMSATSDRIPLHTSTMYAEQHALTPTLHTSTMHAEQHALTLTLHTSTMHAEQHALTLGGLQGMLSNMRSLVLISSSVFWSKVYAAGMVLISDQG